ncbi:MAG TPA: hypothetical protein VGE04_00085, partial [Chloroflexia bacterium]
TLRREEELLQLMSHLPEEHVVRLSRLLEGAEIEESLDLARLAARHPELGEAARDTLRSAETLGELASKAGGLSDEIVEAFGKLAGGGRFTTEQVAGIVREVPRGEGARFARAMRSIPVADVGREGAASAEFLHLIAGNPGRMDALANIAYAPFSAIYRRAGGEARAMDQYLNALTEIEIAMPPGSRATESQRLLDRLAEGDSAAWAQVEDARRAKYGFRTAVPPIAPPGVQAIEARITSQGHANLIRDMAEELGSHQDLYRRYMHELGELSDKQLDAISAIQQADKAGGLGAHNWYDVLDLPAQGFRNDLLDLVADVKGSTRGGLAEAIARGLRPNTTDVQGVLGHFYAARTLSREFPGAVMEFEVAAARREVDIVMTHNGRTIHVEVKTNLASRPSIETRQITTDLMAHIDDGWRDMLYMYSPQQAGELGRVQNAMRRALSTPEMQRALQARGISLSQAESILNQRFQEGMVRVFSY